MRIPMGWGILVLSVALVAAACSSGPGGGACPECSGLRDECTGQGQCTFEGTQPGAPGSRICWSNGLKTVYEASADGGVASTTTLDGGFCHTATTVTKGTGFTVTYRNQGGTLVGTWTADFLTQSGTFECDGETTALSLISSTCGYLQSSPQCIPGACPQ